jgi:hypothetical protein
MPILSGSAKVQGYTRGGECWRWYARGVARHCRPQGANGIERHCRAHAATLLGRRGPVRAAQGLRAGAKATTARPGGGCVGNLGQAIYQPWPAGSRDKACRNHEQSACRTISRLLTSGRAKRQALSTPSPGEPSLKPAHRYLSLRFQTIQSCSPVRYPITTAVQPWREQECAYTFCNLTKPTARRIAGLRCSLYLPTAPLLDQHCFRPLRFCEIPSFLHRFRIFAGPMKTPLCKISF